MCLSCLAKYEENNKLMKPFILLHRFKKLSFLKNESTQKQAKINLRNFNSTKEE